MTVATEFFSYASRNWRARLAISVDMMRELSRYTDPDEAYHIFSRRLTQLYPTDRQLTISRRGLDRPSVRITRYNLWSERINPFKEQHRLPIIRGGLFAELLDADQPRVIDNLQLTLDDPASEYLQGQRSLLAIPIFEYGTTTSMVIVTREDANAFPREQVPELVWMSNLFGRGVQTMVLSDRLQSLYQAAEFELRSIADLQHSLLPPSMPQLKGLELAVHYRTANRAGGDYYDFFPLPDGRLGILVADVSGHGTPAAVLMSITHSLAHSYPGAPTDPGRFLAHLNHHLARHYTVTTGHFVTAVYAIFDPESNVMTYSTAGHPPPRLSSSQGWQPGPSSDRLPLGVSSADRQYPDQSVPMPLGTTAVMFTDGILEGRNLSGETFGIQRLDDILKSADPTPSHVVQSVVQTLDQFASGTTIADDRTLLIVRRVE